MSIGNQNRRTGQGHHRVRRSRPISYDGRDPDSASESQYYRCRFCGFPCSTLRDSQSGYGSGCSNETVTITSYDGTTHTTTQANVTGGCPFCGSYAWKG